MEFLIRHRVHRPARGVEVLVNKKIAHDDLVSLLAEPAQIWKSPAMNLDHDGKNRLGHGRLHVGFTETDVFVKEFLSRSAFDTLRSFGRRSRGAKAFEAGLALLQHGIRTPEPLAAVTHDRAGFIRSTWLITEWIADATSLRKIVDHPDRHAAILDRWPMESLLRALGDLIRLLNEAHICHRDLSLRNVIVPPPGDGAPDQPILWLIDLNRVLISDFASWRPSLAARNVTRLRLADDEFEHVLRAVFPNESQFAANRARFENARARHVAYKRIKKVPRETLTRGNS